MRNPKVIRATIAGLKWAAEALEQGDIECVSISNEDMYREDGFSGLVDTGIRTFTIKYKYLTEEESVLKELL